jgi:omega-amidase
MSDLHITLIQSDIFWEDPVKNIEHFGKLIDAVNDPTDLIILPEMFNTGFSINPLQCAETMDGPTLSFLKEKAIRKKCMITGSLLVQDKNKYFNRLVVCYQDGSVNQYDKRHLFRLSEEDKIFTSGTEKIIVKRKEWKILPLICYDLRFPVWSKNHWIADGYEYDLLIYVANWPQSRIHLWKPLLVARAIENQCYVVGVNRIGNDGHGRPHSGDSMVIGPEGEILVSVEPGQPAVITTTLSMKKLFDFREKYPFAPDWDLFTIHN